MRIGFLALFFVCVLMSAGGVAAGHEGVVVVVDGGTGVPVGDAFVYDRQGRLVGYTSGEGGLPVVPVSGYPLTVRCMGYEPAVISKQTKGRVLLREQSIELPEVVVNPKDRQVLHMLGYVREYSTLTTYRDTVFLFREKTVDFMVPVRNEKRFKGWRYPRVLASKSYYRFTDSGGRDSVSDCFGGHFSWSDWVGLPPRGMRLSDVCRSSGVVVDTVRGRRGAFLVWRRDTSSVKLRVDVLADTASRYWAERLVDFHMGSTDFYRVRIDYDFEDVDGDTILPDNLSMYAFSIESSGRGERLPHVFRSEGPLYVETRAEVYLIDKEYMSVSDARKWEKEPPSVEEVGILVPSGAGVLPDEIRTLVSRVDGIDRDLIRRRVIPDQRLAGFDDLFKTRLSPLEKILYLISPPRMQINTSITSGSR